MAIRDELLGQFDAVDRARSEEIYLGLRRNYSDVAISMRVAREAFDDLKQLSTGSRLGNLPASAVTIVEPRAGTSVSGDVLAFRLRQGMQNHLDRVTAVLGIDRIDAETVTSAELSDLEDRVREYNRRPETR